MFGYLQISIFLGPFLLVTDIVPFLLLHHFLKNSGAKAGLSKPAGLAGVRGMQLLPPLNGQARPGTRSGWQQQAQARPGKLQHLAQRGWKALQTLAHQSLAGAYWSAILTSIFQMGKWRHRPTWSIADAQVLRWLLGRVPRLVRKEGSPELPLMGFICLDCWGGGDC